MEDMAKLFETVDLYVGGNDLLVTNLTGHPSVCLPSGFAKSGDFYSPRAITLTGRLYGESRCSLPRKSCRTLLVNTSSGRRSTKS